MGTPMWVEVSCAKVDSRDGDTDVGGGDMERRRAEEGDGRRGWGVSWA